MLGAIKTNRFEKVNQDLLRLSSNFQIIETTAGLFITDIKAAERSLVIHDIIIEEAKVGIDEIKNLSILEDPDSLSDLAYNIPFAKKLIKIKEKSPLIGKKITAKEIYDFCSKHDKLKSIKINNNSDRLILNSKKSKLIFINILMDNYLKSDLTDFNYESLAKDPLD